MNGVELTTALLEKGITTPLVIMTAHRSAEVALEAIEVGHMTSWSSRCTFHSFRFRSSAHFILVASEKKTRFCGPSLVE